MEAYTNTVAPKNLDASIDEGLVGETSSIDEDGVALIASAELVRAGNIAIPSTIRVCVRLDPAQIDDLPPGRYRGTVYLRATNYADAGIPIVATFRSSRRDGHKMVIAGVGIGVLVKMLTELASGRRSRNPGALHGLRNYVFQWGFPLAITLGLVGAWLGFVELYEANPTWGAGTSDSIKLFGTCFGFQMGGIGGAEMTKRLIA